MGMVPVPIVSEQCTRSTNPHQAYPDANQPGCIRIVEAKDGSTVYENESA
jgi:hypothetical protein